MKNKNEFFYKRLRELSDIKNTSVINEDKTIKNSTLVDFQIAEDGIVYGIVKENHDYFIKKSTNSKNPVVTDFVYMGGLENKKEYQYKSLSEAEKQRNFYIKSLNEALNSNKFKTKKVEAALINEGKKSEIKEDKLEDAEKELKSAEEKVDDLDTATKKEDEESKEEKIVPEPETNPEVNNDNEISNDEPTETSTDDDISNEKGNDEIKSNDTDELVTKEIEKLVGKLTNKVSNTELTPVQTKSFVNSLLSAFKKDIADLDNEDKKNMSDKILKSTPEEDKEKTEETSEIKEEMCNECGGFDNYMTSRGYENPTDASGLEMADIISGYASAHQKGLNDGDFEKVAIYVNPDILKELIEGYGHVEYAEKLQPYLDKVTEDQKFKYYGFEPTMEVEKIKEDEESENLPAEIEPENKPEIAVDSDTLGVVPPTVKTKTVDVNLNTGTVNVTLNESKLTKYIKNRIFNKEKTTINEEKKSDTLRKIDKIIDEELNNYKSKINEEEQIDELLGLTKKEQFQKLNPNDEKAVNDLFVKVFKNILINPQYGIIKKIALNSPIEKKYEILKAASLDKTPFGGTLRIGQNNELVYKNSEFKSQATPSKFAGGGTQGKVSFGGASEAKTVENKSEINELNTETQYFIVELSDGGFLDKDNNNDNNIKNAMHFNNINNAKNAVKIYNNKHNVKGGSIIYSNYPTSETKIINKSEINELFGGSFAEKFSKLQPNDIKGINDLFNNVFKNILTNKQYGIIARLAQVESPENKYEILKTAATQDEKPFGGTLRANNDGTLKYMPTKFKEQMTPSQFAGGGTQGKTQMGGI